MVILLLLFSSRIVDGQSNTFPVSGNVGIGTTSPAKALDIHGDGINLENTTYTNQHGIIFINGNRFVHAFNYGNNGTVTTVGYNTFLGYNAGNFTMGSTATLSSQASYNVAVGSYTLLNNTTGSYNTAIGYANLAGNTTGTDNTAIGLEALYTNTIGNDNVANGMEALFHNTSGSYNIANGNYSLGSNTTGTANTAIGHQALFHNSEGVNNTGDGFSALYSNTTGNTNTANGYETLYYNTTGSGNTAIGSEALWNNTTGTYNIADGYNGGKYIADGSTANTASTNCVFLGASTKSLTALDNNEIVIGYNAIGAGSNSVVLGNTFISKTLLKGNVLIGKTSQQNSSYVLDVNGDARANKVVVNTTGADFVFDSAYQLPKVDSLNAFIEKYHHLPEIQSAQEMQKQGLDVGANQMKLLQKIEELTLYIIDLRKELVIKNQEIQQLETINRRVTVIEEEIKKIKPGSNNNNK
jgi:hypothetical protein